MAPPMGPCWSGPVTARRYHSGQARGVVHSRALEAYSLENPTAEVRGMAVSVKEQQMFVGGEWVPSEGGGTQEILNPATGGVIAVVPKGSAEDVDRAVQAARKAFDEAWFDTTPGERARMLLKLADAVDEHAEELAAIESANVGKPLATTLSEELPVCSDNLRFFAGAARTAQVQSSGEYMRGFTSMLRREPLGVARSIAPWNYPLMMAIWKIAPALAAGNTVVLKPSEWTPLTALRMAELASEIFPPGVLNVIPGAGEPGGAGIGRHAGVGSVSPTGDVATGKG